MYYFTYVLKSAKDNFLYIGWTDDLKSWVAMHNKGKAKSTRDRQPFELVYCEMCLNKEKAIRSKKQLKTGFGRKYLKSRI